MVNKRDKESEREVSESKKHRKTNASTSSDQSTKILKEDVYAVSNHNLKKKQNNFESIRI